MEWTNMKNADGTLQHCNIATFATKIALNLLTHFNSPDNLNFSLQNALLFCIFAVQLKQKKRLNFATGAWNKFFGA